MQKPLEGVSFEYCLDDANAPTQKETQFYSMLGTRAIWHKGWKAATAVPAAPESWGDFHQQRWGLFDVEADPSECNDLASEAPGKAAGADRALVGRSRQIRRAPTRVAERNRDPRRRAASALTAPSPYAYYPGGAALPESVAPNIRNRSYTIAAELEIETPEASGVIFSQGSRFGGHALYLRGGKLKYVYNWLGIHVQTVEADAPSQPATSYLSASFDRENHGTAGPGNPQPVHP